MGEQQPGGHREFDQLAVQHVLGGLDRASSSAFREHLIGCTVCRRRVAELRGIAADLDVAAREERAMVRTKPHVEREAPLEPVTDKPVHGAWVPGRLRNVLIVLLAIVVAILAFWNIHLRQIANGLQAQVEARGEVLDVLVMGEVVAVNEVAAGLDVDIAATADRVALNATGLRALSLSERVVLWGVDEKGEHRVLAFADRAGTPGGRLAMSGPRVGVVELVLTVEAFPFGDEPIGDVLLMASLA